MGFSSDASSANHQLLATSFSCILSTFTWFSSGIRAAFKRSVVSTNHCSASKGFSMPEKIAGRNLLKSDTLSGPCSRGATNSPWRRSFVCCYWLCIIPWSTLIIPSSSLLDPSWEVLGPLRIPRLSISELVEGVTRRSWKVKDWRVSGFKKWIRRREITLHL